MSTIGEQIIKRAFEVLASTPEGVRYSELVRRIIALDGSFRPNTIHGNVWNLDEKFPRKVYKPSRGLFRLTSFRAVDNDELKADLLPKSPAKFKEEEFYEPFADWLLNETEECTKAIALGGNRFRDKWGTPDVIGKRESKRSDIIQAPVEIVSAEIKPDVAQLVTAFGQACASGCSAIKYISSSRTSRRTTRLHAWMRSAKCSASALCCSTPPIRLTHVS